jgi:soluble lytic murein transglycosylase-like protein
LQGAAFENEMLYDVRTSTLFAAFYVSKLSRRFGGDTTLALAAYNVGPTKLRRALNLEGETPGRGYAIKVMKRSSAFPALAVAKAD